MHLAWGTMALGPVITPPQASGGSVTSSHDTAGWASLTWQGTDVQVLFAVGPSLGQAWVTVDGRSNVLVDLYSPTWAFARPLFVREDLPYGSHRVTVVPSGLSNTSASATDVAIDAFDTR
jgi:alpha-L-fucosidase 2